MSIIKPMLYHIQSELEYDLITAISTSDTARADVVKVGYLQGEPDYDAAPISIEVHHGDPDDLEQTWRDEVIEEEMPLARVWQRRFSLSIRALLVDKGYNLEQAADIISTLISRCEASLSTINWSTLVLSGNESLMGCPIEEIETYTIQGGGPDEHDWIGKILFSVKTRSSYT